MFSSFFSALSRQRPVVRKNAASSSENAPETRTEKPARRLKGEFKGHPIAAPPETEAERKPEPPKTAAKKASAEKKAAGKSKEAGPEKPLVLDNATGRGRLATRRRKGGSSPAGSGVFGGPASRSRDGRRARRSERKRRDVLAGQRPRQLARGPQPVADVKPGSMTPGSKRSAKKRLLRLGRRAVPRQRHQARLGPQQGRNARDREAGARGGPEIPRELRRRRSEGGAPTRAGSGNDVPGRAAALSNLSATASRRGAAR